MLKGTRIYLRTVEKDDLSTLLKWENDPTNWKASGTEVPYTEDEMETFIDNQLPIQITGQIRFMIIENQSEKSIGTIDLFDANFRHGFAGVGVLIGELEYRKKGLAKEALDLIIKYCKDRIDLTNLHCSIHADNRDSIDLFEKSGFEKIGIRKDWYLHKGERIDEYLYQLCLKN